MPTVEERPKPPSDLGSKGLEVWDLVWTSGVNWVHPRTDFLLVHLLARHHDEREEIRNSAEIGTNSKTRASLREVDRQILSMLAQLGFTPSDRSRLGFSMVKTESKLEELMRRRLNGEV